MRRRGGHPPRGRFDRPPPPDHYVDYGPPPSPPWERRDPYGYPPSPPPPPGPHGGWHDRPITPPPPWLRDDFDGPPRPPPGGFDDFPPPPPPPRRPPPPSFADDDFHPPPPPFPPNGPPRGRGRGAGGRGSNRGRGLPNGRGEAPTRGTSTPRGRNQMRGSTTRGASNGGTSNATSGASRGRGAPSPARGATNTSRGAPGRGAASTPRGASVPRGTVNGRGVATRGASNFKRGTAQGAVNGRGANASNSGTANWLAGARGGAKNAPQTTNVTKNSAPKTANMDNCQSYSMSNKTKNAVVKASIPGELSFISFKNSLQECCQKQQLPVPVYKTWKNSYGYSAKVEVAGNTFESTGIQGDHKEAQQNAAYNALLNLGLIDATVSFDVKTATAIKRPAIDNSIVQDPYGKRVKLESTSPVITSYKSRLNEFCQKFRLSIPSYDTVKTDTGKGFITTIVFNKKVYQSNGPQPTKKLSEQNAAQVVLHMLNQCPAPPPHCPDVVEQYKQLFSQSTESSSTGTSTSTPTTSKTTTVAVQQIPLPTSPAPASVAQTPIPAPTVQNTTTPTVQHFSTPIVEKISAPVTPPSTAQAIPQSTFTSHKNSLQEYCQKSKIDMPVYFSHRENGVFMCTVHVAGVTYTSNSCNTKKGSEQTAANVALKALGLV